MSKEQLLKKVNQQEGTEGLSMTPRALLQYFGMDRRTKHNTGEIDRFMKEEQLVTLPNYREVYLDETILVRRLTAENGEQDLARLVADYDPVSRIQLLPAANKIPMSVKRDNPVEVAITLMQLHGYSQLPVMSSTREVDGIISWESIAKAMIHCDQTATVRDCMNKDCTIIEHTTPLFKAVADVIDKGLVLVRNESKEICGLVTVTDIGKQFVRMSEPFLILEQIENHIRKMIDGRFTPEELQQIAHNSDDTRVVNTINDLSFGEYVRLIQNTTNWDKLGLNLDRKLFVEQLDQIRIIRNDVMHFHPDGLSEHDLETLRKTSAFFESLEKYV